MATKKPAPKKSIAKTAKKPAKAVKKPTTKAKPTKAKKPAKAKPMAKMVVDRIVLPNGGKIFVKMAKRSKSKNSK